MQNIYKTGGIKIITKDYTFTLKLTDEEYESLNYWYEKVKHSSTAIGGELSFIITPTSIGEIVEAQVGKNILCLRELD